MNFYYHNPQNQQKLHAVQSFFSFLGFHPPHLPPDWFYFQILLGRVWYKYKHQQLKTYRFQNIQQKYAFYSFLKPNLLILCLWVSCKCEIFQFFAVRFWIKTLSTHWNLNHVWWLKIDFIMWLIIFTRQLILNWEYSDIFWYFSPYYNENILCWNLNMSMIQRTSIQTGN